MPETTIISGGLLVDGTGGAAYEADVAIADGRIVEIGKKLTGGRVVDAKGAVVAPGFVDIHTHYDAQLFWDPACTPSIWHGVTSVIIGNCGFALAPCRPENRPQLIQMLVDLEDMPASTLEAGIEWSFSSFADYLASVDRLRPSLNVAAYVGHSPIRIDVMGAAAYERAATDEEIARMAAIVRDAMTAGAVGFASSSAPSGRRSVTGAADEREIVALGQAMGTYGKGVMALVPGGKSLARARMYELQGEIGRPITWTALMSMPDGSHREAEALHRAHYKWGTQVYPQVSSRPMVSTSTMRSAFALRTASMLVLEGKSDEQRIAAYRDPAWRAKCESELEGVRIPVVWSGWELSDSPRFPELVGKNVAGIAKDRGVSPLNALCDIVLEDELATRFTVTSFNYCEEEVIGLLNLDGAVLGLADSGAHPDQICDAVLPTDLLGKWVREKRALPLEKAVRKLTGEPADLFGLDRGYLRVGAPADITIFDPDTIASGPLRRVKDQPAGGERIIADQTKGLLHVFVNGTAIRENGEPLARAAAGGSGKILRPV